MQVGYDGGGGYGGGGYIAGDDGGGGGMYGGGGGGGGGSQGRFGDGGSGRHKDSVLSVSVRQVLAAEHNNPDDKFLVNGKEVAQVTLVARILFMESQVTVMSMKIDDGTGVIDVSHIVDPDAGDEMAAERRSRCSNFTWVRLVGHIRDMEGMRMVDAHRIRPVEDMNELTYHRLEVVRMFCYQTKPRPKSMMPQPKVGSGGGQNTGMNGIGNGVYNYGGGGGGGGDFGGVANDGLVLDPRQRAVYEYLKARATNADPSGVPVADIVREVPLAGGMEAVKSIIDHLASDGHIYSTIDDSHYAFCQI